MRAVHPLWLLLALLPGINACAGVMAEGTRMIYPANSTGRTWLLANTNPWPVLVQTWVDQGEGDPQQGDAPFVVLPAIFRLEPSATERIRILHTGVSLPEDRESLFWLNLYEVPPSNTTAGASEAQMTLVFNTQFKVLYRPEGLTAPDNLAGQLQFRLEQQEGQRCILTHNPTPWHASLTNLGVDSADGMLSTDETDLLLPPFSTRCYRLGDGHLEMEGKVHFSLIDDTGFSEVHQKHLGLVPVSVARAPGAVLSVGKERGER